MIHYLFVGHFERHDSFIRFQREADVEPPLYHPVVTKPLASEGIWRLLREKGLIEIPEDWGVTMDSAGYIVWDRFGGNNDAKDFIVRLAESSGCDLADYSSLTLMSADDLIESADDRG